MFELGFNKKFIVTFIITTRFTRNQTLHNYFIRFIEMERFYKVVHNYYLLYKLKEVQLNKTFAQGLFELG